MNRLTLSTGGLFAVLALCQGADSAHGQAATPGGDAQHGARIAAEGTQAGAPACISCHGVDGNPDGSGSFPRLFGLSQDYLVKQLSDYATGRRSNDMMATVAKSLSGSEAADVAAYYATAKEPLPSFPAGDKGLLILGERLASVGNQTKEVPGCNNCHGPSGIGLPPMIPSLAGQFASYISGQLRLWKQGERNNDGGQQMSSVAKHLSEQDIAALGAYYQQVPAVTHSESQPPSSPSR